MDPPPSAASQAAARIRRFTISDERVMPATASALWRRPKDLDAPVAGDHLPPGSVAARRKTRVGGAAPGSPRIRIVAAWTNDSIISTAGISGVPGKCPWKNSSLTVTFLIATTRRPASCSRMVSTSSDG
jgi:hypothetical protein